MIQRGIATFTLDYGKCPQNYSRIKNKIPKEPQIPLKNYFNIKFYNIIGSYHVEKLPKIKGMISKIK
jgi:hypothetical protein